MSGGKEIWKLPGRVLLHFTTIFLVIFVGRRLPITAVNDEKSFLIEQLSNFIDQQARRRFHQQFQQHHAGKQHGPVPQEMSGPGFSFVLPGNSPNGFLSENDPITFAVSPNDPRYYQSTPKEEYGELENCKKIWVNHTMSCISST